MIGESSLPLAACLDIGGTKALIGFVDSDGNVVAQERFLLSPRPTWTELIRELVDKMHALAQRSGINWNRIVGVGYATTGMMDVRSGIIFSSPNQGQWQDVPLAALLKQAFNLPVWIEMDANAAAIGESWKGFGAGVDYFVHLIIGTGVGSGILFHGEIVHGWRGTAGEIGHTIIDPDGPLCNCGGHGCLESLVSGPAIAARAVQLMRLEQQAVVQGEISSETVFAAARQGDPLACLVVADTVNYLSIGITNLIHLLNPQVITIGGGVGVGGADLLMDPLRRAVRDRVGDWVDMDGTHILSAKLGENAGFLGVSRLVWKGLA
jgi:glucokinase-like ROK family protein